MIFRENIRNPKKRAFGCFASPLSIDNRNVIIGQYPIYDPTFVELFKLFGEKPNINKRRALHMEIWLSQGDIYLKSVKWGVQDDKSAHMTFDSISTTHSTITAFDFTIPVYIIKFVRGDVSAYMAFSHNQINIFMSVNRTSIECIDDIAMKAFDISVEYCKYEYIGVGTEGYVGK